METYVKTIRDEIYEHLEVPNHVNPATISQEFAQ